MGESNPLDKADTPMLIEHSVPVVAFDDVRAILAVCDGRDYEDRRDAP
jgi:hypothetical protein